MMDKRQIEFFAPWPTAKDRADLRDTCSCIAEYYDAIDALIRSFAESDLLELRDEAAEPIIVIPPWALGPKPPPLVPRGQRMRRIVMQRAVKARGRLYRSPA